MKWGACIKNDSDYTIRFERKLLYNREDIFEMLTDAYRFSQWYPFSTGEMDLKVGGKINFDDGEGSSYSAVITKLDFPALFSFEELGELIDITLEDIPEGCLMIFEHTFQNNDWAVNTAVGWHNCLDAFNQIANDEKITWNNDSEQLLKRYRESFNV